MELRRDRRRARQSLLRIAVGLLIVAGAGAAVVRLYSPSTVESPTPQPTPSQSVAVNSVDLIDDMTPVTTEQPEGGTAADAWADALLDVALPVIEQPAPNLDGLAWWRSRDITGELIRTADGTIHLGDEVLAPVEQDVIDILVPDPRNAGALTLIGSLEQEAGVLTLMVDDGMPSAMPEEWRLSGVAPSTAIEALAMQAARRDMRLLAAYVQNVGREGELALVGLIQNELPTPTPTPGGPTPLPTLTPTRTPSPTPTREPDVYLARLIGQMVDPVIAIADTFTPSAVYEFAFGHPRTGLLTWSVEGAHVAGQPMPLSNASELTLYTLVPDDTTGKTNRLLDVTYDGAITRLPAEQVYFQGQRMGEIMYWVVRRGIERGGQFVIVYDDFGQRQTVTFVGFQPMASTTPESP
ncbi:MAG: hypothetical protein ACFB51_17600 [Anaerolineae bacterium]